MKTILLMTTFFLFSNVCQASNTTSSIDSLRPTIKELGKTWSTGLSQKDKNVFLRLHAPNAHYLPDGGQALHGNEAIADYWESLFGFLSELNLEMKSLEGTTNLLYETGIGSVKILQQSGDAELQYFKYVNVWEKQSTGSYRVVIDIFNDIE